MSVFQAGDITDTRPARRLADTIEMLKRLLLALVVVGVGLGVVAGLNGGVLVMLVSALYGLVAAATIYVMFGRFEHTLRLLIGIAHNTADAAGHRRHEVE